MTRKTDAKMTRVLAMFDEEQETGVSGRSLGTSLEFPQGNDGSHYPYSVSSFGLFKKVQ